MTIWALIGVLLVIFGIAVVIIALMRRAHSIGRSYRMTFLKVAIPKKESKEDRERDTEAFSSASHDFKDVVGVMSQFFDSLHSIYSSLYKAKFEGQPFLSLEYAVVDDLIDFYFVCPTELASTIEKKLTGFFADVYIEEVEDYNIFRENSKVSGRYLYCVKPPMYPIRHAEFLNSDPINNIVNSLSKIDPDEGAALQILIKPKNDGWQKKGRKKAKELINSKSKGFTLNPLSWIGSLFSIMVRGADEISSSNEMASERNTQVLEEEIKAMEEKNTKIGFETHIRVVVASDDKHKADDRVSEIIGAFAQYAYPDANGFSYTKYFFSMNRLVKDFIMRRFRRPWTLRLGRRHMIFTSDELSSIFHIPNIKYNRSPNINWKKYKIAPPPDNLPTEGVLLGHNIFRGVKREVRMKNEDRFRHFYVIGQTGTGKSSIMLSMVRQDINMGKGVCVVDPHGSLVEDILPHIPKERADDVIYFNPADTSRPMGLNLLEANSDEERDLVALDAMNIMIKLFDEEIFGPRIQDYFRNGCLTLMEDPEGGALTDIVRLFTDDAYQKIKVDNVKNPIVKSFWTNQMAKTGAREKQEMIPYFAAKFGAFITNTLMRNIIGQTKSAFDFFDVMQENKILLMNLSKGLTGDINSKLLGLIIVSKLQMAALRRQLVPKEERQDFFLYIDEFQNYITDSIESILSEARKYRLGLNIAHQYIGQLVEKQDEKIKNAVFGNVGTMMSYKIGAQDAEFLAKEMAPVFSDQDLINIDKYKAVIKLSIDTQPSQPFSVIPLNPWLDKGDPDVAEAYKQLSRLKYGRDVEFVNREILRRIGSDV